MKIGAILNGLVRLIRTKLELGDEDISLANVAFTEGGVEGSGIQDKIVLSLVNVEEEKTLRYNHTYTTVGQNAAGEPIVVQHNPPVYINLFLVFSSHKSNDGTFSKSLDQIGQIVSLFQEKYIFNKSELTPDTDHAYDRLVLELFSLSFEQMNHLWGVLGGKYIPSVIYKARLFMIKNLPNEGEPLIRNERATLNGA